MLGNFFKYPFVIFFSLNLNICLSQENDIKLIKDRIYQVLISNDSNLSFPYTFTTDEELIFKSNTPGIVMLKLKGNKITEISVTDPNRELLQMNFTVNYKIDTLSKGFRSNWLKDFQFSQLIIDLPSGNFSGSSKTIKL